MLTYLRFLFDLLFGVPQPPTRRWTPTDLTPPADPPRTELVEDTKEPEMELLPPPVLPGRVWIIDNGHGALSPGKRSPVHEDGRQLFEYQHNRDVAVRLMAELDGRGIPYVDLVPDYMEVGNILPERVRRANAYLVDGVQDCVYLSIHANAAGPGNRWTKAHGAETWHYHESRLGGILAHIFQNHLVRGLGGTDRRGVKSRPDRQFYVLKHTDMPAVLVEIGFMNNREEFELLMDPEFRQRTAEVLADAIEEANDRLDAQPLA